jgi:hypothetical protein
MHSNFNIRHETILSDINENYVGVSKAQQLRLFVTAEFPGIVYIFRLTYSHNTVKVFCIVILPCVIDRSKI